MKKLLLRIIKTEIQEKDFDVPGGIISIVFAVLAYISTLATKRTFSSSVIGPKTVPQILSGIVFILGCYLLIRWTVKRVRNKAAQGTVHTEEKEGAVDKNFVFRQVTPILSFLLLALYIFLLKPIGFTFASIVYLTMQIPLLSVDLRAKSFLKAFTIAIIASFSTYFLFVLGFSLKLPKGPFGF